MTCACPPESHGPYKGISGEADCPLKAVEPHSSDGPRRRVRELDEKSRWPTCPRLRCQGVTGRPEVLELCCLVTNYNMDAENRLRLTAREERADVLGGDGSMRASTSGSLERSSSDTISGDLTLRGAPPPIAPIASLCRWPKMGIFEPPAHRRRPGCDRRGLLLAKSISSLRSVSDDSALRERLVDAEHGARRLELAWPSSNRQPARFRRPCCSW